MDKFISIIIVNWNAEKFLENCINSIHQQTYKNFEIIIIDNDSHDNSVDLIRTKYPDVQLIENKKNYGFAEGNNIGLRVSRGDVLVLLNPDTYVEKNWLHELIRPLSDDNIGIVGSKIFYSDKVTLQSVGGYIMPNGSTKHYGYGEKDIGQYNQVTDVDYVTGASIAFRKDLLEMIGFFDKRYFPAYYEEAEFCCRANKVGLRVIYNPESVVYHLESQSTKLFSANYYYWYHKNRLRFVLKNYSLKKFFMEFIPYEHKAYYRKFFMPINILVSKKNNQQNVNNRKEKISFLKAYLVSVVRFVEIMISRFTMRNINK